MANSKELNAELGQIVGECDRILNLQERSAEDKSRLKELTHKAALIKEEIGERDAVENLRNMQQQYGERSAGRAVANQDVVDHGKKEGFSLGRAIIQICEYGCLRGVEKEISDEMKRRSGVEQRGNILAPSGLMTRAAVSTTTGAGAIPTMTENSIIDILRNKSVARKLGAQVLSGVKNAFKLPKVSAASTPGYSAEGSKQADSSPTVNNWSLSPHQLDASVQVTRQFLYESVIPAQGFIVDMLGKDIAVKQDAGVLNGSGSGNQPFGLLNNTAITNTVTFGATGGVATYAKMIEFSKDIDVSNALSNSVKWATTPQGRAHLMSTVKVAGYPVYLMDDNGNCTGYPVVSTNNLPSNLVKSTGTGLSAVILGDWSQVLIVEFGSGDAIDVLVDQFSNSPNVTIRAYLDYDTVALQPGAFAVSYDLMAG